MFYNFKLGQNTMKATKNNCCVKGEYADDYSIVNKWFKKFCSGCKDLDNQARSAKSKTNDSEAVLLAIEANLVSSSQ